MHPDENRAHTGEMRANFVRGRGDYMGMAGDLNDNAAITIFLFTSLLILPLMLIFSTPERDIHRVLMTNSGYMAPFFGVWFAHGAINAWHVHLLRRNYYDNQD